MWPFKTVHCYDQYDEKQINNCSSKLSEIIPHSKSKTHTTYLFNVTEKCAQ